MKLAISNIAWKKELDDRVYPLLKAFNFDGIEIAPTIWFSDTPYDHINEARIIADNLKNKYDFSIFSMQSVCYGKKENLFKSPSESEVLLEYLKKSIDFACAIGCPNIVFGCPKNRVVLKPGHNNEAIHFFKEIGFYISDKEITLSIEPNPVIYGTNFLNTTQDAIEFVKIVDNPKILVNYDLGTVIYNKESINILKSNHQFIGHVHISEPNLELIGQRKLHSDLIKTLKKLNYTKCISIEMKTQNYEDIEKVVKQISEVYYDI